MQFEHEKLRLNVLRNALYHTARRRYFERWNRILNLFVIVAGTAAASDFLARFGVDQIYVGFTVAIVGALQLVCDFGQSARNHQVWQRDYYMLLSEIQERGVSDEKQYNKWWGDLIKITADEPPVLRAVEAKAYNDALDALGTFDPAKERLRIPVLHRLFGGMFSYEGHSYAKIASLT